MVLRIRPKHVVEDTDVIVAQILCGLDKIVDDAEVCTDFDCGKSNADLHVVCSYEKSSSRAE
jgi:hypothetical protein